MTGSSGAAAPAAATLTIGAAPIDIQKDGPGQVSPTWVGHRPERANPGRAPWPLHSPRGPRASKPGPNFETDFASRRAGTRARRAPRPASRTAAGERRGRIGASPGLAAAAAARCVPNPVAITVTRTSSPIESSITAPKMTFAFWSAAPVTTSAASLTSKSPMSGPPVMLSRMPVAPSIDVSSSGEETAPRRLGRAVLAGRGADAHQRRAGVAHDRAHVGEVEVDEPGDGDQVGDALDALAQDVVGHPEGVDDEVWRSTTWSSRSFSITISVSTRSRRFSIPRSACCDACGPRTRTAA